MSGLVYSDLQIRGSSLDIVVIAPIYFDLMNKEQFAESGLFERTVEDVMKLRSMRHLGMLSCVGGVSSARFNEAEPADFTPCGGSLRFRPLPQEGHWLSGQTPMGHYLSCAECDIELIAPKYTLEQLESTLFFLMVTQNGHTDGAVFAVMPFC